MAYNSGIPTTGHSGSQDYLGMKENFAQIATSWAVDRVPLTSVTNVGYSNKLTLLAQGSDPSKIAGGGIGYVKLSGGHAELFFSGEASTGSVVQLTNQSLTASSGQGMLPGGLQIRCGSKAGPGTNIPISFTPFTTDCLFATAISNSNGRTWNVSGLGVSGFTANASGPLGMSDSFYWFAVGY